MSSDALLRVPGLQELLDRCQKRIRLHAALRGVAETVCIAVVCLLAGCLTDFVFPLPGPARCLLLVTACTVILFAAWQRLLRPLLSRAPDDELGAALDLRFPQLQESLATLISVEQPDVSLGEAGSRLMRQRLENSVRTQIRELVPGSVVASGPTLKRWGLVVSVVILLMIPAWLWPSGASLLVQRFLFPFSNLAAPSNLYFEVPNANHTVATGSDVRFVAIPHWRTGTRGSLPTDVVVEIRTGAQQTEHLAMGWDDAEAFFAASLTDVRESVRYRIVSGRAVSEWFQLNVSDAPQIASAVMRVTPPVYSGRPVEAFDGVVGELSVFERSRIDLTLQFNKPVESVELLWKSWAPVPNAEPSRESRVLLPGEAGQLSPEEVAALAITPPSPAAQEASPVIVPEFSPDRTAVAFHFDALGSGDFEFRLTDSFGLTNPSEPSRRLSVIADTPPKLQVTGIRDGLDVRPDDVVPLDCTVTDDVGVGLLEVHFQKNSDAIRILPALDFPRGALTATEEFRIDLSKLEARSGDSISFRIKAADERPIPGPQVVWQGPWTLSIRDDAEPLGEKPLREADQQLVDSLRQLEQKLHQDVQTASELRESSRKNWNEDSQQSVRELSEKEQTQGRELQTLAEQVSQHPLMQKQADTLTQLAQTVRQDVPQTLNDAARADRETASDNLQQTATDLNKVRDELHRVTDQIESTARLEQELAELNRLALEAQELARDTENLQKKLQEREPEPGQTDTDRQEQLAAERQQLQQQQQELSEDLNSLLQRRQELLQAAREAQLNEAAALASEARRLAQQQQQLAEGVVEEARDASRDSQDLANELQKVRNEADQLGQQIQKQAQGVDRPDVKPLDEAIRELRQGNLSAPQAGIEQTQQQLQKAGESLRTPIEPMPGDAEAPPGAAVQPGEDPKRKEQDDKRRSLAEQADNVEQRLEELQHQLAQAAQERGAHPQREQSADESANPTNSPSPQQQQTGENPDAAADADSVPQPDSGQAPQEQARPGQRPNQASTGNPLQPSEAAGQADQRPEEQLVQRLEQMVESAQQQAEALDDSQAENSARQAAQRGDESLRHARAGQFQRAADRMRQAANDSSSAAENLPGEDMQDRRAQMQHQRDSFNQLSDEIRRLQSDPRARIGTQQGSQQNVADTAESLPEPLTELAERLNMPSLGMQQLARPAQEAAAAAQQAAQSGQRASSELNRAQLQQAGQSAQEASGQLNRAAQLAEQAAQGHRDPNAVIPQEVGDSVNDAMYSLQKAAEMMSQESSSTSDSASGSQAPEGSNPGGQAGAPGEGTSDQQPQPGDAPPGSNSSETGQGQGGELQNPSEDAANAPGGNQSGPGQPGQQGRQGNLPSSAQQMAKAAKALQNAARQALPNQFSPGQLSPDGPPSSADVRSQGNPAMFDGQIPDATGRRAKGRVWGQLQDELGNQVGDGGKEVLDSEYSELIRRYRRDLARRASPASPKPPDTDTNND